MDRNILIVLSGESCELPELKNLDQIPGINYEIVRVSSDKSLVTTLLDSAQNQNYGYFLVLEPASCSSNDWERGQQIWPLIGSPEICKQNLRHLDQGSADNNIGILAAPTQIKPMSIPAAEQQLTIQLSQQLLTMVEDEINFMDHVDITAHRSIKVSDLDVEFYIGHPSNQDVVDQFYKDFPDSLQAWEFGYGNYNFPNKTLSSETSFMSIADTKEYFRDHWRKIGHLDQHRLPTADIITKKAERLLNHAISNNYWLSRHFLNILLKCPDISKIDNMILDTNANGGFLRRFLTGICSDKLGFKVVSIELENNQEDREDHPGIDIKCLEKDLSLAEDFSRVLTEDFGLKTKISLPESWYPDPKSPRFHPGNLDKYFKQVADAYPVSILIDPDLTASEAVDYRPYQPNLLQSNFIWTNPQKASESNINWRGDCLKQVSLAHQYILTPALRKIANPYSWRRFHLLSPEHLIAANSQEVKDLVEIIRVELANNHQYHNGEKNRIYPRRWMRLNELGNMFNNNNNNNNNNNTGSQVGTQVIFPDTVYLEPTLASLVTADGIVCPYEGPRLILPEPFDQAPKNLRVFPEAVYFCKKGMGNYGHFFGDFLTPLTYLDKIDGWSDQIPILITHYMANWTIYKQIVARSPKLQSFNWVVHHEGDLIRVDRSLRVINNTGCIERVTLDRILDWLQVPIPPAPSIFPSCLPADIPEDIDLSRVWIIRNKHRGRVIDGREKVLALAKKYNFTVVDLDGTTVDQQIELFNQVRYMIATHGSSLLNIIFRRGAPMSILEIMPEDIQFLNWVRNVAKEFEYSYMRLIGTVRKDPFGEDGVYRFQVDFDKFEKKIQALLDGETDNSNT